MDEKTPRPPTRVVNIVHPIEAALEVIIGKRNVNQYKKQTAQMGYDYFESLSYIRFLISNGVGTPPNDNKKRKARR